MKEEGVGNLPADWCNVGSKADAVPFCHGEERVQPEGKAIYLLVGRHSYLQLKS